MTTNADTGVTAIKLLQSKLDASSHLEVMSEKARCWRASFSFEPPVKLESLEQIQTRWPIPLSYEQFLLYCDGALLYYDDVYGQWGFRFYGTSELLAKNALWQKLYDGWSSSFLVFAESLGDSDLLLIDANRQSDIAGESCVLDGDTGYPVSTWRVIARSFGDWLDRLVVAQGAKYWRWY